MNLKKMIFIVCTFCVSSNVQTVIRIVLTAALVDNYADFRKQQYIDAFIILFKYGYHDLYVIEAIKKQGPTFLEDFSTHVFYSTVNDPTLRNHGINEAKTLMQGCIYFDFDPEDMIIKFTGRHRIISDYFLKIVESNLDCDAIVKVNEDGNVFTLGFAMKYKYMKEMYETMDYAGLNEHMIPIEYRVGDYIKRKKREGEFKVYYIDKLDMTANLLGSSTAPGANEILFY